VPCGTYYDWKKIDIPCDSSRGVPSTSPSVSSIPTFSSPPSIHPSASSRPSTPPSLVPSTIASIPPSSAPTLFPDCSCGVGEFKFELELRIDNRPHQTSWKIEDGNGEILASESGYNWGEKWTIFNYEYCLPVGCYDFVIDDSYGDGICCASDYFDDGSFDDYFLDYYGVVEIDDLDGYYEGSIYGLKEVFHGGNFQFNAIENFCGEDLCA